MLFFNFYVDLNNDAINIQGDGQQGIFEIENYCSYKRVNTKQVKI